MTRSRRRLAIAAGLVAVVAVAGGAWALGSRVQSPAQAAARAAPPEPSLVTVAVERRVLSATVIARADIAAASSVEVTGATLDGSGVVTGLFVGRGDAVAAGQRVVEVAGRPVFVFAGPTPAYRALRPGMSGADVSQLQAGLVELGCAAGASAAYDDATKACVEWLYAGAGYSVTRSSPTELADLAGAEAAVADADDALAVAQVALHEAAQPASPGERTATEAAVAAARRSLDAATADRPTLIDQAARHADDAVADAAATLAAARASAAATPADASLQAAVGNAERAHAGALADRQVLVDRATRQADDAVAAAEAGLAAAEASLDALAAPGTALQALAVEQQARTVERARAALAELEAASGPIVPFGEIVFVPRLPARVDAVAAVVGQPAGGGTPGAGGSGPLVVLATPEMDARVSVPQASAGLVQAGTPVELLYEATGEVITGTVRSVGDELELSPTSGLPAHPAVVDAELPERWSGLNVRATFSAATTEAEVLVVPLAAVSSDAGGRTRVQVARADGSVATVAVTAGLSADGFVEVSTAGGELAEGDRVVIGR